LSQLVPAHGGGPLKPLLLEGEARAEEVRKAARLKRVPMTSRETSDLIMLGIGAFTPLPGFMGRDDWRSCCDEYRLPSQGGLFWPVPITLSAEPSLAGAIAIGEEVALWDAETDALMGTMTVEEKYGIDKDHECRQVFRTTDAKHPGVEKVLAQGALNLAGPVKVLSESYYPEMFPSIYQRPHEARRIFEERGWSTVAALQLRNPMHGSHAYLAWVAIEVCDGVYVHQLVGKLKPGDIPAEVRVRAIDALVSKYFRKERVVQGGYPMEMRYAGPREALLHAVFRQNYGCSHLIVGPSTPRRSSPRSPGAPSPSSPSPWTGRSTATSAARWPR
jgi:sulfate adenylyltransferase